MLNRSYYALVIILAIPHSFGLCNNMDVVTVFQPNDVLARTTSSTGFGLIPIPFTFENFFALFAFGHTPLWFFNSIIVALGMT